MKTLNKTIIKYGIQQFLCNILHYIKHLFCVTTIVMLIPSIPIFGQTVVGEITRPGLKPWSLAVYENGNKVFVGDNETGNLLIFDGTSLELLDELSIEGGCGGSSFCIHEASGKLYFCTFPSGNHVAVVDANTNQLLKYLTIDGYVPQVDEELGQVYIVSRLSPYVLYVIDVETDEFVTVSLCNGAGLTSGSAVNPVTHEVFIGFLHGDSLDIVNGETLERITVPGNRGRGMVINWLENKVYRELGTFDGTWIYDRDAGTSVTIKHWNDAEPSVFNPVSNKIYTTSEVNHQVTIINGETDTYSNFPLSTGLNPAVCYSTNHVFFSGLQNIFVLDDSTQLLEIIAVDNPDPSSGIVSDIVINQTTGRIYVINDGDALDFITVLQDSDIMIRPPVFVGSAGSFETYILDPISKVIVERYYPTYLGHGLVVYPGSSRLYEATYNKFSMDGALRIYEGCGNHSLLSSIETGGNDPVVPVITPDGSKIYVTNSGSDNVSVIATASNSISSIITVGDNPWGTAITPDGSKVYVLNKDNNNAYVINTVSNTVIDTIELGTNPWGIAVNPSGTKAYIANSGSGTVSVININADEVIATITVGLTPHWLAFAPNGKYVYVTNSESASVSIIDAGSDIVIQTIPVNANPEGIAAFPDGSDVYVATNSTVNIINTSDYSVSTITLPDPSPPYSHKLIPLVIADPTSRIAGRVMSDGMPVNNAIVRALQAGVEKGNASTNAAGDYSIFNLKSGTYNIEVTAPGYFYQFLGCQEVGSGRTKILNFNPLTSICEGDSIYLEGEYQNSAGTYYDTLQTIHGCDSVIITELIVQPVFETNAAEEICEGESILLGGEPQTTSGTYYDTLQTINGCDSIIITELIINDLPFVFFGEDTIITTNDTIVLDAGSDYINYIWSNGSNEQTITIANLSVGEYEYSVKVTNIDNCTNSDTIIIHVILPNSLSGPHTTFDLEIFPNPTSNFLFIKSDINIKSEFTITLIDNLGRIVFMKKINKIETNKEITFDLSNLNNGFYVLRINDYDVVTIHKIIKY